MFKSLKLLLKGETPSDTMLIKLGRVVSDASRCVQCGICVYNCPVGIQVRDFVRQGLPVTDSSCISCGNCVDMCPRGTLRWETEEHEVILARFAAQMSLEEK